MNVPSESPPDEARRTAMPAATPASSSWKQRLEALRAYSAMSPQEILENLSDIFPQALNEPNLLCIKTALQILDKVKEEPAFLSLPVLAEVVRVLLTATLLHTNSTIASTAQKLLNEFSVTTPSAMFNALSDEMQSPSPVVVKSTIQCLTSIVRFHRTCGVQTDVQDMVFLLIETLQCKDSDVRKASQEAVITILDECASKDGILAMLESELPKANYAALQAAMASASAAAGGAVGSAGGGAATERERERDNPPRMRRSTLPLKNPQRSPDTQRIDYFGGMNPEGAGADPLEGFIQITPNWENIITNPATNWSEKKGILDAIYEEVSAMDVSTVPSTLAWSTLFRVMRQLLELETNQLCVVLAIRIVGALSLVVQNMASPTARGFFSAVIGKLKDKKPAIVQACHRTLCQLLASSITLTEGLPDVLGGLANKSPDVRLEVSNLLGMVYAAPPEFFEPDADGPVRRIAARSMLSPKGLAAVLRAEVALLSDASQQIRFAVSEALYALTKAHIHVEACAPVLSEVVFNPLLNCGKAASSAQLLQAVAQKPIQGSAAGEASRLKAIIKRIKDDLETGAIPPALLIAGDGRMAASFSRTPVKQVLSPGRRGSEDLSAHSSRQRPARHVPTPALEVPAQSVSAGKQLSRQARSQPMTPLVSGQRRGSETSAGGGAGVGTGAGGAGAARAHAPGPSQMRAPQLQRIQPPQSQSQPQQQQQQEQQQQQQQQQYPPPPQPAQMPAPTASASDVEGLRHFRVSIGGRWQQQRPAPDPLVLRPLDHILASPAVTGFLSSKFRLTTLFVDQTNTMMMLSPQSCAPLEMAESRDALLQAAGDVFQGLDPRLLRLDSRLGVEQLLDALQDLWASIDIHKVLAVVSGAPDAAGLSHGGSPHMPRAIGPHQLLSDGADVVADALTVTDVYVAFARVFEVVSRALMLVLIIPYSAEYSVFASAAAPVGAPVGADAGSFPAVVSQVFATLDACLRACFTGHNPTLCDSMLDTIVPVLSRTILLLPRETDRDLADVLARAADSIFPHIISFAENPRYIFELVSGEMLVIAAELAMDINVTEFVDALAAILAESHRQGVSLTGNLNETDDYLWLLSTTRELMKLYAAPASVQALSRLFEAIVRLLRQDLPLTVILGSPSAGLSAGLPPDLRARLQAMLPFNQGDARLCKNVQMLSGDREHMLAHQEPIITAMKLTINAARANPVLLTPDLARLLVKLVIRSLRVHRARGGPLCFRLVRYSAILLLECCQVSECALALSRKELAMLMITAGYFSNMTFIADAFVDATADACTDVSELYSGLVTALNDYASSDVLFDSVIALLVEVYTLFLGHTARKPDVDLGTSSHLQLNTDATIKGLGRVNMPFYAVPPDLRENGAFLEYLQSSVVEKILAVLSGRLSEALVHPLSPRGASGGTGGGASNRLGIDQAVLSLARNFNLACSFVLQNVDPALLSSPSIILELVNPQTNRYFADIYRTSETLFGVEEKVVRFCLRFICSLTQSIVGTATGQKAFHAVQHMPVYYAMLLGTMRAKAPDPPAGSLPKRRLTRLVDIPARPPTLEGGKPDALRCAEVPDDKLAQIRALLALMPGARDEGLPMLHDIVLQLSGVNDSARIRHSEMDGAFGAYTDSCFASVLRSTLGVSERTCLHLLSGLKKFHAAWCTRFNVASNEPNELSEASAGPAEAPGAPGAESDYLSDLSALQLQLDRGRQRQ